jgi:arrestin-related trafficking adapter 3/6
VLSPDIPFAPRSGFHWHASGTLTPTSLTEPARTRASSQSRPPASRLDSLVDRSSHFERLIAGHESEAGEAPPAYDEVVTNRDTVQSIT